MPLKDPEQRKKYHTQYMKKVWYPKNKQKHLTYVKRNKQRVAEFIEKYKKERACTDCGFSGQKHPYVLDFDHIGGRTTKTFTIGSWSHSVLSISKIEKEIQKCELVCANCHRIRTFKSKPRRNG